MPRPRKKLPLEIEVQIKRLAFEGHGAQQILTYLQRTYADSADQALRAAALALDYKTVLRRVQEYGPPDDTEPWTLAKATPAEAAVVMPVLGALLQANARLADLDDPVLRALLVHRRISVGLARWIVKVAAAAPDLPPEWVHAVAREYRARELQEARSERRPLATDHETLDAFLACRPWASEEAAARYERLLEAGILKQPMYLGRWWRDILEVNQLRQRLTGLAGDLARLRERRAAVDALRQRLEAASSRLEALASASIRRTDDVKTLEDELRAIEAELARAEHSMEGGAHEQHQ